MNPLKLRILENAEIINEISVDSLKHLTIGRDKGNELVLEHSNISRFHCVVSCDESQWKIEDLNSTNGLKVNEEKQVSHELVNHDEISLHPYTIIILDGASENIDLEEEDATVFHNDNIEVEEDSTITSPSPPPTTELEDSTFVESSPALFSLAVHTGPMAGFNLQISTSITIGRDESNDFILQDPSVSRKHLELVLEGSTLSFSTLSPANTILLNGVDSKSSKLKNKDRLTIGSSEIEICKNNESSPSGIAEIYSLHKIKILSGFLIIFFCIILSMIVLNKKNDTPSKELSNSTSSQKVENTPISIEADLKRKKDFSIHFEDAEKHIKEGSFELAISSLKMCLKEIPGDTRALDKKKEVELLIEEQGEQLKIREQHVDDYRNAAEALIQQSLEHKKNGDFESSIKILNEIANDAHLYPELHGLFAKVKTTQKETKIAWRNVKEEQRKKEKSLREKITEVKALYVAGNDAMKKADYTAAKVNWEAAVKIDVDAIEKQKSMEGLAKIEQLLVLKVKKDLTKAYALKKEKKLPSSLLYFRKVVLIDPEHIQAKKEYEVLFKKQSTEAVQSYQLGLIYEGINNLVQAKKHWKDVLKKLPIEDSEYYIKAKQKLDEYN